MSDVPRVLRSRKVYEGRVFTVRIDTIDDGKPRELDIVEHPGSFAIAPVPAPGRLVLIEQYRHAAGRRLWEIPAGTAERDENCEAGARRELREETGYTAGSLQLLCSAYPTPGYATELVRLYVARDLRAGPQEARRRRAHRPARGVLRRRLAHASKRRNHRHENNTRAPVASRPSGINKFYEESII